MSNPIKLRQAVKYNSKRTNSENVLLENFVSTDNILQNKAGITKASNLPPNGTSMPAYESENILVANIRPYLKKIWFANMSGGCSSDVLVFDVNKEYFPKYIYYSMFRDDFFDHMMRGSKGTKMPRGDKNQILDFLVPDFDFSTQQKIASVLSSLDSKIDLNNCIIEELESMAKTIYDYWFVQFDFPDKKGKHYKTSGGKMVWNDEMKREIPEGWKVDKIGNKFSTSLGGTPATNIKEYWESGTINWLNSGEVANFPIIESEFKITNAAILDSATELLPKGSVLLSITRHLRPSILAIDACANQSVVGIKENGSFKSYYLFPYLKNEIQKLNTMRTGAQQPHINKDIVDSSLIIIPDDKTLRMYNKTVEPLFNLIINNAFQNKNLSELRDWLLPMLMNGQVKVNENT